VGLTNAIALDRPGGTCTRLAVDDRRFDDVVELFTDTAEIAALPDPPRSLRSRYRVTTGARRAGGQAMTAVAAVNSNRARDRRVRSTRAHDEQ